MSVQAEVTRITNAANDIRVAIIEKGVALEDTTKIDGFAEKIREINEVATLHEVAEYIGIVLQ